jgi:hypothetical protein
MLIQDEQEGRVAMFPHNSPSILEHLVRVKQEELARQEFHNRLVPEFSQDDTGAKPVKLKYRLLVLIGMLSALMWFLR